MYKHSVNLSRCYQGCYGDVLGIVRFEEFMKALLTSYPGQSLILSTGTGGSESNA
jgi:hypothetical protein